MFRDRISTRQIWKDLYSGLFSGFSKSVFRGEIPPRFAAMSRKLSFLACPAANDVEKLGTMSFLSRTQSGANAPLRTKEWRKTAIPFRIIPS